MEKTLMQAALDADDAWSTEGQKVFGKRWGDARYTAAAQGEPGTALAGYYACYVAARDAWHAAGQPLDREPRTVCPPPTGSIEDEQAH